MHDQVVLFNQIMGDQRRAIGYESILECPPGEEVQSRGDDRARLNFVGVVFDEDFGLRDLQWGRRNPMLSAAVNL